MPPRTPARLAALLSAAAVPALLVAAPAMAADDPLADACGACHAAEGGGYERIDAVRKTPEAWDMTVVRMMRNHGLQLSAEDRGAIVGYLADTRGLSIAETEGFRYILEKEPLASDEGPDQLMTEMCSRCHSFARVALQRRAPEDWKKLLNFHVGQFPTLEYQALARDRDWWGIANGEVLAYLQASFPLGEAPAPLAADLFGDWAIAGHMPGRGDYRGTMNAVETDGAYDLTLSLLFPDGPVEMTGVALVYGAGEWRATLTNGETELRMVAAASADGTLSGRWFETEADVIGARFEAAKMDAAPAILGATPGFIKAGEATEVTFTGPGLTGAPVLPEGVTGEIVSAVPGTVVMSLTAAGPGAYAVGLGGVSASIAAYASVDYIAIEPSLTISRVGGNGGPIPKVPAQFEAVAMLNGPDGAQGTEDDIRLGAMKASWRVENFDEAAAAVDDAAFAGTIDGNGLFTPGDAGPNPARHMGTNNAGNLKVVATVDVGGATLEGEAHLYATVQRFVDTPIR